MCHLAKSRSRRDARGGRCATWQLATRGHRATAPPGQTGEATAPGFVYGFLAVAFRVLGKRVVRARTRDVDA
ncbi:hypothetical protein BE21_03140 [Sorangium cellulosum]|uniref:Uncharacterized protein n=1 Tax=Sorangium cellulosum TaxID=56 RepID=A0A150TPD0_SORCE|nr:hypothetical protein BE21_03140 [Sorangium cellulosum]